MKNEIPDFTVQDGKLVTDDPSVENLPISIDEGNLHVYYDASGTLDEDDVDNKIGSFDGAFAFLSKEIYVTAGGISQSVSYKTLGIENKDNLLSLYASITDMSKIFYSCYFITYFLICTGLHFFPCCVIRIIWLHFNRIRSWWYFLQRKLDDGDLCHYACRYVYDDYGMVTNCRTLWDGN
ncbi:hypothetical protein MCOL2_01907 [Listeria fleischmannii FSL S10-1203]|uniref:Uncharacterized protein n=1 Tax=Listeria fleischmannii FSL S10-1203 TaxID=1265822 RepID=W7DQ81_9LIST|nr:hypothetical protein MCOL2_01907 [Listeria fleischmannii FSL S10-1203]